MAVRTEPVEVQFLKAPLTYSRFSLRQIFINQTFLALFSKDENSF
jgi:hypothetical protein